MAHDPLISCKAELWSGDQNKFGNFTQQHTSRATGNTFVRRAANALQRFRAVEITISVNEDVNCPFIIRTAGLSSFSFYAKQKDTTEGHGVTLDLLVS